MNAAPELSGAGISGTGFILEARQDVIEQYDAANALLQAECVVFDVDDTLVTHDPQAQYWVALHTLATSHGAEGQMQPDQFARNYQVAQDQDPQADRTDLYSYLTDVRKLSAEATGNPESFERVAQAFVDFPNDGNVLKQAIKSLPGYESSGPFWEARARMLQESGVPASFGKQLCLGMAELTDQLRILGKHVAVISNSREDLVRSMLKELLPRGGEVITEIVAVGGTDTPVKPAREPFEALQECSEEPIDPARTLYVGNSREDVDFAQNVGMPVLIVGEHAQEMGASMGVQDVRSLAHVLRRHSDGASILRLAMRDASDIVVYDGELVKPMDSAQMHAMAAEGLRQLWSRQLTQAVEAYTSNAWSSEFPSLRQLPDFCDSFGPLMGDIHVDALPTHPALAAYYTEERTHQLGKGISLRGPGYFAVVDPRFETAESRLQALGTELDAAVNTLDIINRNDIAPDELLGYLGVLDNAKQQALSMFHAITYNERRSGIPKDPSYLELRERMFDIAIRSTRSFYEACLGREFSDPVTPDAVADMQQRLAGFEGDIPMKSFKIQELDHPLRIMLASYNIAARGPVDAVVGFPSGGSQMAISTACAAELLHELPPRSVDVLCIPLSQHSGTTKENARPISDEDLLASVGVFADHIQGRRVMIVDDNSSTGSTIERGTKAIEHFQPTSVNAGVAEIDPQRMLVRARRALQAGDTAPMRVADMRHDVFAGTAGIVPISSRDIQLRKEYAGRVLGLRSKWSLTR